MTPDTLSTRIAKFRALREKATAGHWEWQDWSDDNGTDRRWLAAPPSSRPDGIFDLRPDLGPRILCADDLIENEADKEFIAAAANEALPLLSDLEKRIEELERELVFVKSHHTARYVVNMTQENETLKARLEAAEAENRKLREALSSLTSMAAHIVKQGEAVPDGCDLGHELGCAYYFAEQLLTAARAAIAKAGEKGEG